MNIVLEAGADDLKTDDPEYFEIQTSPEQFESVLKALNTSNTPVEEEKVGLIASTHAAVSEEESEKLQKLLDALEDNDDVQSVYSNVEY